MRRIYTGSMPTESPRQAPDTHDHQDCRVKLAAMYDRCATLEIALVDLVTEATHGLRFSEHFETSLERAKRVLAGADRP